MKRITKMLATLAVTTLLIPSQALAYDFEFGGIYYNVTSIENLTVEVTTYCATNLNEYDEINTAATLQFPKQLHTKTGN